jgi:hypothetical protein
LVFASVLVLVGLDVVVGYSELLAVAEEVVEEFLLLVFVVRYSELLEVGEVVLEVSLLPVVVVGYSELLTVAEGVLRESLLVVVVGYTEDSVLVMVRSVV